MDSSKTIVGLYHKLKSFKFAHLEDEKALQTDIETAIKTIVEGTVEREYRLSDKDIVDFFWKEPGLAIEIKVKGRPKEIYRQLERYAQHDQVKCLLLMTSKTMGIPAFINDKPVFYMSLGQAWLS